MIAPSVLRVIDANVDRCVEGLRVLEDVARFVLDDAALSARVRDLRHRIGHAVSGVDAGLLASRRPEEDVGAAPGLPEEPRLGLAQLVRANAKRVEEALRVLEEFSRLPDLPPELDPARFKSVRFDVYEIERTLGGRLLRHDLVQRVRGLYVILDPTATHGRPELEVLEEALTGGALLARCLNGTPLTPEHGAPLRLVASGRACFYSVKWVGRLEVLAEEAPTTGATIARNRLQRRG